MSREVEYFITKKLSGQGRHVSFGVFHYSLLFSQELPFFLVLLLRFFTFFKDFFNSRISFSIFALSNCNGSGKMVLLFQNRDRNLEFSKFCLFLFYFCFILVYTCRFLFFRSFWLSNESSHGRPKLQTLSAFFVISSLVVSTGYLLIIT
jgi:hypothetical protein